MHNIYYFLSALHKSVKFQLTVLLYYNYDFNGCMFICRMYEQRHHW